MATALTALVFACLGAAVWLLLLSPSSQGSAPAEAAGNLRGRIAFEGGDGNIWSVDPDGGDLLAHSEDAEQETRRYRFPTWSPDGSTLAFVELTTGETGPRSALHFYDTASGEELRHDTPATPIYLYWNPDGTALTYLANRQNGLTLELFDPHTAQSTRLGEGAPLYFSWRPDGQRLLAHIGLTTLAFVERDGEQTALDAQGGLFQAPAWSRDGSRVAYVSADEAGRFLLQSADAVGEQVQTIADSGSIFTMGWSADSRRLAYSYMTERLPLAAYGPLWVHDVASGEAVQIASASVVGFFWSPDGEKLAYLQHEGGGPPPAQEISSGPQQESDFWLRWYLWDGEYSHPLSRFAPTTAFSSDYLQYFDQYAQSVSLWSPESEALVYSGSDETGRAGVWVLPIAEGSAPLWVGAGTLAAWSPSPPNERPAR